MFRVHKTKILANNKQKTYFAKASGTSRFAYNWALARWQQQYQEGLKPNESKLRKELNSIKKEQYPWMYEVTKVSPQQAIKDLGNAFNRFFNKQSGYPQFKKKGVNDSFRADNGPQKEGVDAVAVNGNKIKLPKIGWVKLAEKIRFPGRIISVTVSRTADSWYASITVDTIPPVHHTEKQGVVGLDVGISVLAIASNGQKFDAVKPYNSLIKRVSRLNRKVSRKKIGSNNRYKAKKKLARLHAKIANIRSDTIHKMTYDLTYNYSGICIEDLNVTGMLKNRKLSRRIMDCGFYEIRRQFEYKSKLYDTELKIADRFFPSSKRCHQCYTINKTLQLSDRNWQCNVCDTIHNRDLNAAINLAQYFELSTESLPGFQACGEKSAGAAVNFA